MKKKYLYLFFLIFMFFAFSSNVWAIDYSNLCGEREIKQTMKIIGYIILLMKWLVPLILIVLGMIDFGKSVIDGNEDSIKIATNKFIKKLISGIIVFFVPSIILAVLNVIGIVQGIEKDDTQFGACTKCMFDPINNCEIPDEIVDNSDNNTNNTHNSNVNNNTNNNSNSSNSNSNGNANVNNGQNKNNNTNQNNNLNENFNSNSNSNSNHNSNNNPNSNSSNNYINRNALLIVQEAENIYNNSEFKSKFKYISPSDSNSDYIRARSYREAVTNSSPTGGYYQADCNSFVGIVVKRATGLGGNPNDSSLSLSEITIAGPSNGTWVVRSYHKNNFEVVDNNMSLSEALNKAQVGDLLASNGDGSTHIQIYIGNNCVIGNTGGSAVITKRCNNNIPHDEGVFTIIRLK